MKGKSQKLICFIDHFDSFSFNVLAWLTGGAGSPEVVRIPADDVSRVRKLKDAKCPVIFSPGPGSPLDAIESLDLCRMIVGRAPVFGICLGHQILGVTAGLEIKKASEPFHGARRAIIVNEDSFFLGDVPDFYAATYNSLVLKVPKDQKIGSIQARIAATCEFGEIQAIESVHGVKAVGVQFHPESFLSDDLSKFRDRWLDYAVAWMANQSSAAAPLLMPS